MPEKIPYVIHHALPCFRSLACLMVSGKYEPLMKFFCSNGLYALHDATKSHTVHLITSEYC